MMRVRSFQAEMGGARARETTPPIPLKDKLIPLLPLVNLNHFRLLRVVGKGAFGKVRIVERKDTGLTFALKYIRKEEGLSDLQLSNGRASHS
jgi:serine/threonine protein kinase